MLAALPGELVELVQEDHPHLRQLGLAPASPEEAGQEGLHVVPHVARPGEGGGAGAHRGQAQVVRQGAHQVGLPASRGAHQEEVGLGAQEGS